MASELFIGNLEKTESQRTKTRPEENKALSFLEFGFLVTDSELCFFDSRFGFMDFRVFNRAYQSRSMVVQASHVLCTSLHKKNCIIWSATLNRPENWRRTGADVLTYLPEIALTFFTLQGHSGLQVVHLELQAFQGAVGVPGLPLVGDQHGDDDEQQQAAAPADADDSGKRQQAVGVDVESPRGVLEPTGSDLNTNTGNVDQSEEER